MAKIFTPIPSLKLNDSNSLPMLAYGTGTAWFKKAGSNDFDKDLVESIKTAIKLGYYHLDCAESYGTEKELGIAIKESGVDRSKLFVTTKVNKTIHDIPTAIKNSLQKLQLDYVDLFLVHEPFFAKSPTDLQNAWAAMESVQAAGQAKSIGVSNFLQPHFETILKTATVVPAVNQIEFHPYLQHGDLLEFHKQHGIATEAYGPITPVTKAGPGPASEYLAALAKKYAVNEAEIALRWGIDQDVSVVTTSSKEQRLSDYLRCATFKLTPAEIKELRELGEKMHFRGFWKKHFDENDRS